MIENLNLDYKFYTDPGDRYEPLYTPEILDNGEIELVQTGVEDLWELHDSCKDSCDVNFLVQRYLAGDETALNRGNPMFLDLLGAPKTLAEAYQINFRAQNAFENLPASVKEKFGNSYMQFIEHAGTPEWFDILKMDYPDIKKEESGSVDA